MADNIFNDLYRAKKIMMICGRNDTNKYIKLILRRYLRKRYSIFIGQNTEIKGNIILPHPQNIVLGNGVKIGNNVTIYQDVTIGVKKIDDANIGSSYAAIEDNVCIYAGAKIIGNIVVGNSSVIGCNSVVNKDVPSKCIFAGVPAKKIGVVEANT